MFFIYDIILYENNFNISTGKIFCYSFFFAPYLIYTGYKINNNILLVLGFILLIYEIFWICLYPSNKIII